MINWLTKGRKKGGSSIINLSANDKYYDWLAESFDPKTLKGYKQSIAQGRMHLQEELFRTMFDNWAELRENHQEISGAVARLNWSVSAFAKRGEKPTPEDQAIADTIEAAIWASEPENDKFQQSFTELIEALTYIASRGSTVHEILWANDGNLIRPKAYVAVSARHYAWAYGAHEPDRLLLYPDGIETGHGIPFPTDKFLIGMHKSGLDHPIFNANLRCLIGWFGASQWGLKWLMQYCQIFGIPFRTAKANGEDARRDAERMLQSIGAAGWGVSTEDFEFVIHDVVKGANSLPQADLIKMANEQCNKLILGQTLTSSKGDGGAYALGKIHEGVREEVIRAAAGKVAEVLNNQLIPSIIKLNYGKLPQGLPEITFSIPNSEIDKGKLDYVDGIVNRIKLPVSTQYVYETLGVPQPSETDDIFSPALSDPYGDDISAALSQNVKKN